MFRSSSSGTLLKSRGSAIAGAVGAGAVAIIALALYLPLVGFLGAVTASTAGIVPFPALSVLAVTVVGVVVTAGLLALALTRRRAPAAWTLAVLGVLVALAVTAFPLVAVVLGSAQRVGEIGPVVAILWQRVSEIF
ncbi:MFS transporter permease [uncultured Microbacterium sp.]|uniref:MFS transporter permease n=1 Tax=uncultured Microbacterium sp. TaxID=191216 RepID=UPI00374A9225